MKILIAEDEAVSRRVLQATLSKWGFEVVACADGVAAWDAIRQPDAPQLVVLDWMMPGLDGLEICRLMREREGEGAPYSYILLLTGKTEREDIVQGLEAGADDYVAKPFDASELKVRLRAGQRILELQAALVATQDELRNQATHDSLTGIWNRGAIIDILERELNRASRQQSPTSVVMADIDHFKQINDTHGHAAGDDALKAAVKAIQAALRPFDLVGRYGGEEFLVVVPNCEAAGAAVVAERIRRTLSETNVATGSQSLQVSGSFGVATNVPAQPASIDALIQLADAALYRAKASGRNRVEVAA